ncbi:tyrosine-type recombinase/integrase [Sphaerisporangium sp. NBC_01403]|uniref:tyrosine-type recombinase/integrase n=1 Tax=Sphaerisporangium sp. NBC_01403 TaxID=2903599 RepID=UPI00386AB195
MTDLGYNRGWRTLAVTRKGGKRQALPWPRPSPTPSITTSPAGPDSSQSHQSRLQGPLFVTGASGPYRGGKRLDRWAITKLIRRIAQAAAIPSAAKLTPHSLRHSLATLSLDAGAALRDVQDAMGHADPRTTAPMTAPATPSTASRTGRSAPRSTPGDVAVRESTEDSHWRCAMRTPRSPALSLGFTVETVRLQ